MRSSPNLDVIKEPRGFIKCLEIFLAIFAFACATGFRGNFSISQTNTNTTRSHTAKGSFKYPFDGSIKLQMLHTNTSSITDVNVPVDERSSTEFFVVIGVFCFLYSLAVLVYYIMFEEESSNSQQATSGKMLTPPIIDFVAGGFWAFFWFVSACAQAAAVNGIKDATDPSSLIKTLMYCKDPFVCTVESSAKYATLTISILLGFLNVFVWCGNMWFLWKETPWHSANRHGNAPAATVAPPQQQPPMAAAI